ncbi:hypothetical protein PLESTB_000570700 [Pleodorina starrii]|uniref:Uncharacterized protein n=1 Tax=Pleodorina starrii TaxID=330485 RepID=A0A9W6F1B5_9CHLO|nr:hypothetical protein PLESTM_000314000 [Pleodorina starrii]GLC51991.1 hypothetical protein PLESTB_000570700 [Pleodorina starrii]GLC72134.1 hypothetical protein PLESTF_001210800 [Pleodorina starrii]
MLAREALHASSRVLRATSAFTTRQLRLSPGSPLTPAPPCARTLLRRHHSTPAAASGADAATTPSSSPALLHDSSAAAAAIVARFSGRTCLIQGASRGLGLEFVRQLLELPDTTVVATCRSPATAAQLHELLHEQEEEEGQQQQQQQRRYLSPMAGRENAPAADATATTTTTNGGRKRLHVIRLDLCEEESIRRASEQVSELVPSLDLLVNCSAVLHGPDGMAPETSYSRIRGDHMTLSFATNAIGPLLVCRSFLPLLLRSPGATEQQPALIANMSARVGSLGDNRLGGWYSYRASKAALNQMSLTLSLELRRKREPAAVVMLHPGTCDTDLSKPYHRNVPPGKLFDRPRAVRQLLGILAGVRAEDSGRFIAWDGQDVPW